MSNITQLKNACYYAMQCKTAQYPFNLDIPKPVKDRAIEYGLKGIVGGAGLGALIRAIRRKSLGKGLAYGALYGGVGGTTYGVDRGYQEKREQEQEDFLKSMGFK